MKAINTGILAIAALLLTACSKYEFDNGASPVVDGQGSAKSPNVFVYASDGGQAVANYQFAVHCGPVMATNASGRLTFGGGCTTLSQLGAGNHCFERNTYYFLKPPGNSNGRKFLRFKFSSTFDPSTLTSALVRYEPDAYTWTVPNQVPGFEYAIYDIQKDLPFCHGSIIRQ
jgi:hypothetical protein